MAHPSVNPAAASVASNGLVPYTGDSAAASRILMPLASASQAAEAINAYETLKTAIVRPEQDIQIIQGRPFLKKSFWRRVAACFGLSLELVSEERLILDGKLAYRATYRAVAPNGRAMDGDGMCMQGEKGQMIEHNIRAIAHTRAKNRAISDIVGGGEVSAEEMPDDDGEQPQRATQVQQAPQAPQRRQQATPASPWKAMTDADILQALNHLDIRGRAAVQAFLGTIKAEMEQGGLAWTRDQVLAYIAEHYGSGDVTADGGEETNAGNWSVTPMGANDAHDLSQLDTGTPGN